MRVIITIVVAGALLLTGWIVARLTGAVQVYTTPSVANFPTLQVGELFFTSNLVPPKRLDFIAYRHDEPYRESAVFFHRLAGLPGDTLEMRRGCLYVNGQNLDAGLHLMHHYSLAKADFGLLPTTLALDTLDTARLPMADSVYHLGLPDADVTRLKLPAHRSVLAANYADPAIQEAYKQAWNQDNFGPVVVPANSYFVLGDNRHNALDSRYAGFILRSSFKGTMLGSPLKPWLP